MVTLNPNGKQSPQLFGVAPEREYILRSEFVKLFDKHKEILREQISEEYKQGFSGYHKFDQTKMIIDFVALAASPEEQLFATFSVARAIQKLEVDGQIMSSEIALTRFAKDILSAVKPDSQGNESNTDS